MRHCLNSQADTARPLQRRMDLPVRQNGAVDLLVRRNWVSSIAICWPGHWPHLTLALVLVLAPGLSAHELVVESVLLTIARQAEVSAREEGLLAEVNVREGQTVKPGDLLARLDDEAANLAYHRAVIDLERAQKFAHNDVKVRLAIKELERVQAELKRAIEASKRVTKSVTDAELDQLKLDVQRATLEIEQAEFELATARLVVRAQENELQSAMERTRRCRINSPIAGTVVAVHRRLGEWLEAGQIVVRVIATDRLRAEGFLQAGDVSGELVGRKVRLTIDLPSLREQQFAGTVVFVNPEVDVLNGQARLWAEIENPDGRLRPGLKGSLVIEK